MADITFEGYNVVRAIQRVDEILADWENSKDVVMRYYVNYTVVLATHCRLAIEKLPTGCESPQELLENLHNGDRFQAAAHHAVFAAMNVANMFWPDDTESGKQRHGMKINGTSIKLGKLRQKRGEELVDWFSIDRDISPMAKVRNIRNIIAHIDEYSDLLPLDAMPKEEMLIAINSNARLSLFGQKLEIKPLGEEMKRIIYTGKEIRKRWQ